MKGDSGGSARPPGRTGLSPVAENPFYVLGLTPSASREEVEREGQKLISMLTVGLASVARYPTPVGWQPRTVEGVRWAMHELRDPHQRLVHAPWAVLPPSRRQTDPSTWPLVFDGGLRAAGLDFSR